MRSPCRRLSFFVWVCVQSALGSSGLASAVSGKQLASINVHGQSGVKQEQAAAALSSKNLTRRNPADGRYQQEEGGLEKEDVEAQKDCIENVIQRDPHNVGQATAAPILYAKRLGLTGCIAETPVDLTAGKEMLRRISNRSLIFGGGGLFNQKLEDLSERIFENAKSSIIVWGAGFAELVDNAPKSPKLPGYLRAAASGSIEFGQLKLLGLRDYFDEDHPLLDDQDSLNALLRWVPCASAMNPAFDRYLRSSGGAALGSGRSYALAGTPRKRAIGYVRPNDASARAGCERTGSPHGGLDDWVEKGLLTREDVAPEFLMMEDMLKFIAGSEVVVTNAYHPAYWATLLGKKVIICNRWSNEFDHFRWPVEQYTGNLEEDIIRAKNYPEAMMEAREANMAFAAEVKAVLSMPGSPQSNPQSNPQQGPPMLRSDEQMFPSRRNFIILAVGLALVITVVLGADTLRKRQRPRWLQLRWLQQERAQHQHGLAAQGENVLHSMRREGPRAPSSSPPSLSTPQLGHPPAM